ncbi:hypothetical protein SNEBB_003000 [Seison nebaliae]|nr:hypothetical protein SNEBB_003000 [Seison nebaliae]
MFYLWIFFFATFSTTTTANKYCYSSNRNAFSKLFVTKTKYDEVKSNDIDHMDSTNVQQCPPKFVYILTRHAARSPSVSFMNDIKHLIDDNSPKYLLKNSTGLAENLCDADQNLTEWESPWSPDSKVGDLASNYTLEKVMELGQKIKTILPNLMNDYDKHLDSLLLRSTNTQRTIETLKALFWSLTPDYNETDQQSFMDKYFGKQNNGLNLINKDDMVFYAMKSCSSYDKIQNNSICHQLSENYLETHLPESALEAISQRLSIDYSFL